MVEVIVALSLHTLRPQREFFFSALFEVCPLLNGKWETWSHASSSQLASLQIPSANYLACFGVQSTSQGSLPGVAGTLEAKSTLLSPVRYTLYPHQVNSQCCLANNIAESLAESAAAYTKATARKCLLEKVEVITGEEAESNVLQVRWPQVGLLALRWKCEGHQ